MKDSPYFSQARLLVRCLPALAAADCFALKGGTAINLFVRDMPRLSVDIDLAFLPLSPREQALQGVGAGLNAFCQRADQLVPGLRITAAGAKDNPKRVLNTPDAQIRIEPNLVVRGTVFPPENRRLTAAAEALFEASATVRVVSVADLYAGKLCAALDRQHPRDWFDVALLLADEGLTDAIRLAFVVYLASHSRPMAELLAPTPAPLRTLVEREFSGMTRDPIPVERLEAAQQQLPSRIRAALTFQERQFLLSIKQNEPDWTLLPIPHLAELPAIRWKLQNIEQLARSPRRHERAIANLRRVLDL